MPGQGRVGDKALGIDGHGCPGCPHVVNGPATEGASDVIINGKRAVRKGDSGIHKACCGANRWTANGGSATVTINGKPAFRLTDGTDHCGGKGTLIQGSGNVIVGDSQSSGFTRAAKNHAPFVCNCNQRPGDKTKPSVKNNKAIKNASDSQKNQIDTAHKKAIEMISKSISTLEKAKDSPNPKVDEYFEIHGTSEDDKKKLSVLVDRFSNMKKGLEKNSYKVVNEKIEPGKPYTVAYVYTLPIIGGVGPVNICFPAFSHEDPDEQAATIVHEMSHYSSGTEDYAYVWETKKWRGMSQSQKMANADTFSEFSKDIF